MDKGRINSLIETADARIRIIGKINEENCNFVFEDYYTSLLEFLQALIINKGYNVLNHVCTGFYIKDVLKREDLYNLFEDIMYKRNSLTYYGKRMELRSAKDAIDKCKRLIEEIKELLE